MSRRVLGIVAVAAILGLGACADREREHAAAGGVCKAFPKDAAAPSDPAAATDDCLHRWGYALAKADDEAGTVARAVVAACGTELGRWNQQALAGPAQGEVASLMTGEPMTPIAAHLTFAQDRALVYVVEARAGKCAAPRIATRPAVTTTTP